MTAHQILNMDTGPVMDELITSIVREFDEELAHQPWSTDLMAALELRTFISVIGYDVSLIRLAEAPRDLNECVEIMNQEEGSSVSISAAHIPEAMSRAFLLFHYKFFGNHRNIKDGQAMGTGMRRQRPAKIYPWPTKP
ncbi:hypothetical protein [Paenibacillus sp. 1P07SE]|uniref:hypothetical protein n=1 Tax=Paenibacillus sp. 1P07SE TaxID=3132209 RepID=UPI0039A4D41A